MSVVKYDWMHSADLEFMHDWIAAEYGYVAVGNKEFLDVGGLVDYTKADWERAVKAYRNYLMRQREQAAADSYEDEAELKWYIHTPS